MELRIVFSIFFSTFILSSCHQDEPSKGECMSDKVLDTSRGTCNQVLPYTPSVSWSATSMTRTVTSNSIPNHKVGLFGAGPGSLNPNAIREITRSYHLSATPAINSTLTPLLATSGTPAGPQYAFGILLNGVELDPVAAEPFPHEGAMSPKANWGWNLEALNVNLGLDCNNAHVQPNGKYHYHGSPALYLDALHVSTDQMTLIGFAADGLPVYYLFAYIDANDTTSAIIPMTPSYRLKTGDRPGDGITAPCGTYDGVYTADYEYVPGLGTLDEANGRTGITPEYPEGTYYYMITETFPGIPRYFRGTPSSDFKI